MPDLQNFSIVPDGKVTAVCPQYKIHCNVCGSQWGEDLGIIDINFPEILSKFTQEEMDDIFNQIGGIIISKLIDKNTNLNTGKIEQKITVLHDSKYTTTRIIELK